MCPLPLDWPERARRALPGDVASSHTAGDLASALEHWVETSDGNRREALSLLIEYVAASGSLTNERAERALAWGAVDLAPHYQASDIVPGWDPDLRVLFDALAKHTPSLLQGARERFPGRAQEQLDFALALVGLGPWPTQAMVAVARRYLNCPPGTFAYEDRIPANVLGEATRRLLREENVPLLEWSRIQPLLSSADDEFRCLILTNYCGERFRSRAMELVRGLGAGFDERLERALDGGAVSFAGSIAAALVLARRKGRAWGERIPERVREALLWDLRCGSDEEAAVSLACYSELSETAAAQLLRECLREERAIALIPAVADDQVILDLLTRLETSASASPVVVEALVACGQRVVPLLEAACASKKPGAVLATVCAEVLGELSAAPQLLVQLLGHSSKRVTAVAARALERLGANARAELDQGARTQKKTVRTHCERLLARLEEQSHDERTPLFDVRRRASELSPDARAHFVGAFSRAVAQGAGEGEALWHAELQPRVQELGAVALELLREWFAQQVAEGETRLWCYAVEELRAEADAVWVAVDTFCRMPKLSASLWARPRRALGHCGALLGPPVVHCLRSVHTEYREVLYGLLASFASSLEPEVFLQGLRDHSKTVRTHSVDGLSRATEPPVAEVAALLTGHEMGTRIAAAELLAVWGRSDATPRVVEAWTTERSSKVRPYLEDTLVACGREDLVFGSSASGELTEADVERFLCAQPLPQKLPAFVKLDAAPPLHFRSGAQLTSAACHGLLSRLMLLDSTLKGRATRALLRLFRPDDVHQWGQWIYDGWARARNSKHKWAVLQLSLLSTEELLDRAMLDLGSWRGSEHAAIQCHLRAAQWHGSERAVQWLGYWSENLSSLGARATARQLLGRVAFKQGRSVAQLRQDLEPFLVEELVEHALVAELPAGYQRERLTFELERAWLTGRTWSGAALLQLFARQSYLAPERLVLSYGPIPQPQAGRSCWFRAGRFVDVTGDEVSLEQRFWLAHPLDTVFAELGPPPHRAAGEADPALAQQDRETYLPEQLPSLLGRRISPERFARFRRRFRWFHGEPMDAGIVYTDSLQLLGQNLSITLHHSGYGIGAEELDEDVRFLRLDFADLDGQPLQVDRVPPVVYSELHRSLALLTAQD